MFCALLTSRYQVSVYRTNGPLVLFSYVNDPGPRSFLQYSHTFIISISCLRLFFRLQAAIFSVKKHCFYIFE